jgi:hypothetical protein
MSNILENGNLKSDSIIYFQDYMPFFGIKIVTSGLSPLDTLLSDVDLSQSLSFLYTFAHRIVVKCKY